MSADGDTVSRLEAVNASITKAAIDANRDPGDVTLVAVSKTKSAEEIRPVLEAGQRVFGENRVQEAQGKWPGLLADFSDVELRLLGPLQSNKADIAVGLFDVIESIDRPKIAKAIASEMEKQGRSPDLYVQINTGLEPQKAGVAPDEAVAFVAWCRDSLNLTITGLMCIPPVDENPGPHFALLRKLAAEADVGKLSMGMSADYDVAVGFGATSVRVGTAIFGAR